MLDKIIHHKYFYHVVIAIIIVIAVVLFVNKKKKEEQFDLLMGAINDTASTGNAEVDAKTAAEKSKTLSAFDPKYYKYGKAGQKATVLNQAGLEQYSKRIYDAKQIYGDNESDVIAALKQIKYKTQLSQLSEYFAKKYNKDLRTYLESFMDSKGTTMKEVVEIVNKMSDGWIR